MRLTPLGKFLLFLIGLGLILTALHRFVPREQQIWRQWIGGGSAPAPGAPPATSTPKMANGPGSLAEQPLAAESWVTIPAGTLLAGESATPTEVPAFRIHRHEVTNGEYAAFLANCPVGSSCGPRELPSYWDDAGYVSSHRDFPVVFVSSEDAAAFCRQAGGRLPTTVEWERAARGNDSRLFPWGDSLEATFANILGADHAAKSQAPKQIPTWGVTDARLRRDQGPFGVLAMAGNVSEWTASRSPEEPDLVLVAGGSWDSWELADARVTHRVPKLPTDRSSSVGFRCAAAGR